MGFAFASHFVKAAKRKTAAEAAVLAFVRLISSCRHRLP
jgi:hypothetical protein